MNEFKSTQKKASNRFQFISPKNFDQNVYQLATICLTNQIVPTH